MDGGIGVDSGITALVTIIAQISQLSYNYAVDMRSASRVQQSYFQKVKALKDVLEHLVRALDTGFGTAASSGRPE